MSDCHYGEDLCSLLKSISQNYLICSFSNLQNWFNGYLCVAIVVDCLVVGNQLRIFEFCRD